MSRAPNRSSVARKLVLGVIGLSILVSTLAALAAFAVFYDKAARQQVTSLSHYVDERLVVEERLFSDLRTVHAAAAGALMRRLPTVDGPELDRQFDAFFPLQADGTRRSAPALFDGLDGPGGDRIYGLGAFMADGRNVSREDKALLIAATRAVAQVGEAHLGRYDNLYFFTPSDRQVMFGPLRDDRLLFYRKNAPASFTMQPEEAAQIALPSANPARVTRCTKLRQIIYKSGKGQPRGTGCITPLDIGGRHVGAFGTTVMIGENLLGSAADRLPGSATLIVSETGELIASPGYRDGATRPEDVAARKVLDRMGETLARIRAAGGRHGVVESPDHDALVAYGQMFGPSWRLLIVLPKSAVLRSALESALTVLVVGLLAVGLLSTVALVLIRRSVVKPLEALAAWAGARGRGAPLEAVEARTDEIGALARALREARGEADDLLATLEHRVRERTAELEKANQAKSSFLANMSHELRTPLNGVVATGDLLVKEARTKRSRELAELVAASGRLLEHVLTDILDFSKIEAGEMRLTPIAFDLDGCVPRIAEIHRSAAEAKGLTLTCTVTPAARGAWVGDEIRIAQILSNLLSNAVKFTQTGGVTLAADADEGGLRLTVSDTGIGFPCEESERIFRRFEQADASTTRKFGGTGLGLSICASLCRLMGGSIQARSTPGEGSTFAVVLPLERAEASAVAAQATTETAGREGLRILLAEDHPTNQRVVRLILEPAGVELTVVDDGRKALDAFESGDFDVVLMDLQMPVMDGLEATAAIRALEISTGRARTPIVALTANALDEHVAASRQAGADRHVSKPIHAAILLGVLQELTADPASVSANPHRAA